MKTTYRHTQFGTVLVAAFLLSAAVVAAIIVSHGWRSLTLVVFAILILCVLLFYCLKIEITDGILKCRFGIGLIKKLFDLAEIVEVKPVKNKWYYGWGIHFTPHGWLFNVSGFHAVEIALKSGKRYRIGTDEPDRLAGAIRDNLKTAPDEAP